MKKVRKENLKKHEHFIHTKHGNSYYRSNRQVQQLDQAATAHLLITQSPTAIKLKFACIMQSDTSTCLQYKLKLCKPDVSLVLLSMILYLKTVL